MKAVSEFKQCPSCRSKIYRKNFRAEVIRCTGGCGKLICKQCAIATMCNECYMSENTVQIVSDYYEKVNILSARRGEPV